MRCFCASSRWMARQANEGGIPGRISTEENAARRRMGAHKGGGFPGQDAGLAKDRNLVATRFLARPQGEPDHRGTGQAECDCRTQPQITRHGLAFLVEERKEYELRRL